MMMMLLTSMMMTMLMMIIDFGSGRVHPALHDNGNTRCPQRTARHPQQSTLVLVWTPRKTISRLIKAVQFGVQDINRLSVCRIRLTGHA
nr:hypothetical protein BaRGS_014204 [Batillaria attramentaria]